MAENELPIPLEIPWRLASTTQTLQAGGPEPATISLFHYEPVLENLEQDYPDERLIYLKFTVSVSPLRFLEELFPNPDLTGLEDFVPVHHLVLDLKVWAVAHSPGSSPTPLHVGAIRPYFHAAAPLHRSMIQTGIVGYELYEGESDGVSIGKSGSQMHETVSSQTRTKTSQSGGGAAAVVPTPLPTMVTASGSSASSTTTVDSERTVDQLVETTSREASQERRELLSHTTRVENVLSLLDAKHVGSPYLRFSLWPRPIIPLSMGPADAGLWYAHLLNRRSSGIEGIQEFLAVLMVPRGLAFCIEATLHAAGLLDVPPQAPDYLALRDQPSSSADRADIDEYLHTVYPTGTPFDELDVDFELGKDFARAAVIEWFVDKEVTRVFGKAPGKFEDQPYYEAIGELVGRMYKTNVELRLEALRFRYEEELARSPVERGIVLMRTLGLNTCFAQHEDGAIGVTSFSETSPDVLAHLPQWDPPMLGQLTARAPGIESRFRPAHAVVRWNAFANGLAARLTNMQNSLGPQVGPHHPRMVDLVIERWKRLAIDDPRNLSLEQSARRLRLRAADVRRLASAGVKNLRDLARAIDTAPRIDRLNRRLAEVAVGLPRARHERARAKAKARLPRQLRLTPVKFPLGVEAAARIRSAIARGLKG